MIHFYDNKQLQVRVYEIIDASLPLCIIIFTCRAKISQYKFVPSNHKTETFQKLFRHFISSQIEKVFFADKSYAMRIYHGKIHYRSTKWFVCKFFYFIQVETSKFSRLAQIIKHKINQNIFLCKVKFRSFLVCWIRTIH